MTADLLLQRSGSFFSKHAEDRHIFIKQFKDASGKDKRLSFHFSDLIHQDKIAVFGVSKNAYSEAVKHLRKSLGSGVSAADSHAVLIAAEDPGVVLIAAEDPGVVLIPEMLSPVREAPAEQDAFALTIYTEPAVPGISAFVTVRNPPSLHFGSSFSTLFIKVVFPTWISPVKKTCILFSDRVLNYFIILFL